VLGVRVTYASKRLAAKCASFDAMRKEWGVAVAKALAQRIEDMRAAQSPDTLLLLPGRWEWLSGTRSHEMSARVSPNWRLIVEPAEDEKSVEMIGLEDYH
jgi:proteic killer suppression protein